MNPCSMVKYLKTRETKDTFNCTFQRKLHVTKNIVKRLSLEYELEGHTGCVNCLQWNEAGDILASGSDDLNILLWTPFLLKKVNTLQSGHQGNIFSVKFLPGSNDHSVVSGAADFKIRVNDITTNAATFSCFCHGGRVKRLATSTYNPFMFWSAAEDGMVMEFDLRAPHQCSNVCNNVLVNLVNHLGRTAEAKCIAINPLNSDLLAVGANDPYIRLYDRRMIRPTTARFSSERGSSSWDSSYTGEPVEPGDDNLIPGCVSYFVAGHIPFKQNDFKRRYRSLTSTYVTFSPDGKDLLANLGGEQIYLFDLVTKRKQLINIMCEKSLHLNLKPENVKTDCCDEFCLSRNGTSATNGLTSMRISHSPSCLRRNLDTSSSSQLDSKNADTENIEPLPPEIHELKECANKAFNRQEYSLAIRLYSAGIVECPNGAYLYGNRAAAYIRRGWDGDVYAAVRDCLTALQLNPNYLKAHFRLAQCLHKLNWSKESYDSLQAFKLRFADYSKTKVFENFETEVKRTVVSEMCENDTENGAASNSGHSHHALPVPLISDLEKNWRSSAFDYEYRYCGHCNTTTDIKEANFLGSYGEYIVAGSDDGYIFIWDRKTTNIVRVLKGDDSIVNCLQPHPSTCVLATSGIDPIVRIWSPKAEDGSKDEREVLDKDDAAFANQRRMNADPLEIMLLNMGYRLPGVLEQMSEEIESRPGSDRSAVQCRTS